MTLRDVDGVVHIILKRETHASFGLTTCGITYYVHHSPLQAPINNHVSPLPLNPCKENSTCLGCLANLA